MNKYMLVQSLILFGVIISLLTMWYMLTYSLPKTGLMMAPYGDLPVCIGAGIGVMFLSSALIIELFVKDKEEECS